MNNEIFVNYGFVEKHNVFCKLFSNLGFYVYIENDISPILIYFDFKFSRFRLTDTSVSDESSLSHIIEIIIEIDKNILANYGANYSIDNLIESFEHFGIRCETISTK